MNFELPCPDLSAWRAGNTGTPGVWQFESGLPGRHVMISALVHGNELCGAWALMGLLQAGVRPLQGSLTLAFCNLDAFDRFDAGNNHASRLVEEDLNRQWIDERMQAGNTLERRRAAALLPFVQAADWLLDLHSMHDGGPPLVLAGVQPRNLALAQQIGAPAHVVIDAGHHDGVRMRDYGRFGQMVDDGSRYLLIECGFHGELASRHVAQDQCVRFLAASGVVPQKTLTTMLPGWLGPDEPEQWALHVTGPVVAKSGDFRFAAVYRGLDVIANAGTVIAWNGDVPVVTPYDDCVLVMPSSAPARAGVTAVRFARRTLLARQSSKP